MGEFGMGKQKNVNFAAKLIGQTILGGKLLK